MGRGFVLGGIVLAVGLIAFSFLDALADSLVAFPGLGTLRWVVRLAPGNASYHSELGRYLQVTNRDLKQALAEYQTAARLNPSDASAWFDIARLEQVLGDSREQGRALEQAVLAAPRKPDVAWEAANFLLLRGDRDDAMREFRVVLENDGVAAPAVLELIWRVNPDIDALLERVIPPRPDTYHAFLSLLISQDQAGAAAKVWASLIALQQPFSQHVGLEYTDYLLSKRLAEPAQEAWIEMAPLCGLTAYLPSSQNLIVNPRFEQDVLNAGFDWHYYEQSNVKITLDSSPTGGSHGLQVSFLGLGFSETGLFQQVAVEPHTQYQFSVHFKTDELEGAGGPAFVVRDELTGEVYLTTETLKNPGSWREVAGHFETGPEARLVSVRMVRIPAGNAMRGHLWMDEVSLGPI